MFGILFIPNSARARFLSGNSDLLTDVSAFHQCLKMRSEKKTQNMIKSFCEEVREVLPHDMTYC